MPRTRFYSHFWFLYFDEEEMQRSACSADEAQRIGQQLADEHQRNVVCKHYVGYEVYRLNAGGVWYWDYQDEVVTNHRGLSEGVRFFLERQPVRAVGGAYRPRMAAVAC